MGHFVNRRHFLAASALPLVSIAAPGLLTSVQAQPVPFDRSVVRQMARDLAGESFKAPDNKLEGPGLRSLRAIRFFPDGRRDVAKAGDGKGRELDDARLPFA